MTNEELCVKAQRGDLDARNELILQNINFIRAQAWDLIQKYSKYDIRESDLEQEGCAGMIRAVSSFDAKLGNKFLTYAKPWIVKYMKKHIKGDVKNQPPGFTIHYTIWYENRHKADERRYDWRPQEDRVLRFVRVEQLYEGFKQLTPRQQEYIRHRFGFDEEDRERSLTETAEHFHLRFTRAKSLEQEALKFLRNYIIRDDEKRPAPQKPKPPKLLIGW